MGKLLENVLLARIKENLNMITETIRNPKRKIHRQRNSKSDKHREIGANSETNLYDRLLELTVPDEVILVGHADDIAAILLAREAQELHLRENAVMLVNNWIRENHLELAEEK